MAWWDPVARVGEYEPVGHASGPSATWPRPGAARPRAASVPRPRRRPRPGLLEHGQRRLRGPVPGRRLPATPLPSPVRTPAGPRCTIGAMTTSNTADTRIERDSMGEMEVPADALYGASTQRAVLNFPISGQRFPRRFIRGARAHQARRGRDERRARPARRRTSPRPSPRRRARSPTARTTTSSPSTSTRPARAPRRTRT